MAALAQWLPLAHRLSIRGTRPTRVKLSESGHAFSFHIGNAYDLIALEESLLNRDYDFDYQPSPRIIVDIGANVGASVAYFRCRFPNAVIHAVEPDPRAFATLQLNHGQDSAVKLHQLALGRRNGTASLGMVPGKTNASSLLWRAQATESVEVPLQTLDAFIKAQGIEQIDILKFDIEGAEYELLQNFANVDRVRELVGELHYDLVPVSKNQLLAVFEPFSLTWRALSDERAIVHGARKP